MLLFSSIAAVTQMVLWSAFGHVIPSRGGLVVFKEQQHLPNSMAKAMVFSYYSDHGGWDTLFVNKSGGRVVLNGRGELGFFHSNEIDITNLAHGESLNRCIATIDRLRKLSQLNPSVAETLSPILNDLQRDVAAVEAGKLLINGEWKNQELSTGFAPTQPIVILHPPKKGWIPVFKNCEIKQTRIPLLTTTEGNTYKDATHKLSSVSKVAFSHADGAARIPWELLKKKDQLDWGYDSEKVKTESLAKQKAEKEILAAALLEKKKEAEIRASAGNEKAVPGS